MSAMDTSIKQGGEAVQGGAPVLERGVTMRVEQLRKLIEAAREADFTCEECGETSPAPEMCDDCDGRGELRCRCSDCDDDHYKECTACNAYGYHDLHCICGEKKRPLRLRIGPALFDPDELSQALVLAHHNERAYIGWDVERNVISGFVIVSGTSKMLKAKVAQ